MQRLKLDINPTGEIPVLYVAQYDKGRSFEVELVDGEQAYNVPSGYSVQLNVRKTDSKLVTAAPTNVAENILTFATSEQMTACAGENIGSVTLKDADDIVITTLYFLISVQRDVLAGGLDSASEIHNLEQQIAAIVPEVIGDDYYNKSETDALLANKANISDLDNLASKAELEHAIDEEDASIKDWAYTQFATPGYIANRYYNKTQVDELLFNMLPVGNASGNPCTFETEIEAVLQALTAEIIASSGGGTPSNPIPIVGHSELNLDVNGNTFTVQFGQTVYGGVYDKSGKLTITRAIKTYNGLEAWTTTGTNDGTKYRPTLNEDMSAFIMPSDFNVAVNCICNMFEGKSAQQTYERVEGISWQPSGSWRIYTPDYDTNDISLWKTFLSNNPLQVVCELATPIVIDVQAISPYAVVGTNNIISECNGDVNVSYKDNIQHYIDNH